MADTYAGYISEERKKHFTILVGVLGAVFLIMQFVAPLVIMFSMMSNFMTSTVNMKDFRIDRAVYWHGSMWYTEHAIGIGSQKEQPSTLIQWPVQDKAKPKSVGTIPLKGAYLLASTDGIWIISENHVGLWTEAGYKEKQQGTNLGVISNPFFMDGIPAVLANRPEGWVLMEFVNNTWQRQDEIVIPYPKQKAVAEPELRVVVLFGRPDIYMKYGNSLYLSTLPLNSNEKKVHWIILGKIHGPWSVVSDGEKVYLAENRKIMLLPGGAWKKPIKLNTATLRVCLSLTDRKNLVALTETTFNTLRMAVFHGQKKIIDLKTAGDGPIPEHFMSIALIPQIVGYAMPFLLAFILSLLMRRDRVIRYEKDGTSYEFASIIRRGVSMLVDVVILAFPMLLGSILLFSSDFEKLAEGKTHIPVVFGLFFVGFIWAFVCFLIFSFMEGRKGITPGKWLTGIRVLGTDLKPCGFGRAIVRNLLKVVDGFFSFLVGVLVVAFTENWQRVGDMAARTIVIRKNTRKEKQFNATGS
ncbi:MAG: RDD family protein [Acidobacteria bacterium]|nr:RDD family protein [Acidobacteriota bacterium]